MSLQGYSLSRTEPRDLEKTMPSSRETVLAALHTQLQTLAAPVLRGDAMPKLTPATSLIILRDGKPGEPELALWRDRQSKTR